MTKLDTLKERSQIVSIIKLTIAVTSILLLCAGLMNSNNKIEEKVLKENVEEIISIEELKQNDFKLQESNLCNISYKSKNIGKSYELFLTRESSSIKMKVYQLDDVDLLDLIFEKVVEDTYTSIKRKESNCFGDCNMPTVKYDVAIENMDSASIEFWQANEAYTYLNSEGYYRHQLYVIKSDNKILTLGIVNHDLSLANPLIERLADEFNQFDLNKI